MNWLKRLFGKKDAPIASTYQGDIKPGDMVMLVRPSGCGCTPIYGLPFMVKEVVFGSYPDCVHESMIMPVTTRRTFLRIALPNGR